MNHPKYTYLKCFFFLFLLLNSSFVVAQVLCGKVVDDKSEPIPYANIVISHIPTVGTSSNLYGVFKIHLPYLPIKITASAMGFHTTSKDISSVKDTIIITLSEESLSIPGVIVTASKKSSANGTSSYKIEEQAIAQIQAMSLGDVLTLLPGNVMKTPSLTDVEQFNLRSASSSTSNSAISNAFGSQIVRDGINMSNDGNMQAYNPASGLYGGKSVVGKGIDLRDIPTTGIESVEVVMGVPSAKYGNVASGIIIIKNKTVPHKFTVNAMMNATNYQLGLTQGLKIGNNNVLTYNLTGSYSKGSPIQTKDFYRSVGTDVHWRYTNPKIHNMTNNMAFSFLYNYNGQKFEKEDLLRNKQILRNTNIRFSDNGSIDLLQNLNYSFSFSLNKQYSHLEEHNTNGPLPLIQGLETGTYASGYSSFNYDVQKTVIGMPINLQGYINATQTINLKRFRFNFDTGIQFSYDKNIGKGLINSDLPVGQIGSLGSRDILFHEIPPSITFSAYHELNSLFRLSKHYELNLNTGLRYDDMLMRYHLLSPRISGEIIINRWLHLRSAWGIGYKAPAMIQLYPGPSYIDYMNLGFYSNNPKERMALVTTYKYLPDNRSLKPMKGTTFEMGIDFDIHKMAKIQVTYFHKTISHSIITSPELLILPLQRYKVVKRYENKWPDVVAIPDEAPHIAQILHNMRNDGKSVNTGVEVSIYSEEIKSTHTKFEMAFSFNKTSEINYGKRLIFSQYVIGNNVKQIGVYDNIRVNSYRGNGNIGITQQIPKLGLIFNFNCELFFYKYSRHIAPQLYPKGYYNLKGEYFALTPKQAREKRYKDLVLSEWTFKNSSRPPFYPNLHLTVRKELKGGSYISFYAHNFLWYNPVYTFNDVRIELNDQISFGFGLTLKL